MHFCSSHKHIYYSQALFSMDLHACVQQLQCRPLQRHICRGNGKCVYCVPPRQRWALQGPTVSHHVSGAVPAPPCSEHSPDSSLCLRARPDVCNRPAPSRGKLCTVIFLPYPDRQTDEPLRYWECRLLTRLANVWDVWGLQAS